MTSGELSERFQRSYEGGGMREREREYAELRERGVYESHGATYGVTQDNGMRGEDNIDFGLNDLVLDAGCAGASEIRVEELERELFNSVEMLGECKEEVSHVAFAAPLVHTVFVCPFVHTMCVCPFVHTVCACSHCSHGVGGTRCVRAPVCGTRLLVHPVCAFAELVPYGQVNCGASRSLRGKRAAGGSGGCFGGRFEEEGERGQR